MLFAHGFTDENEYRAADMAYVEQRIGLTVPCDWLEWRNHLDGFTYAWLAGTEPGDMAAPADWTPEQSRNMTRTDLRGDDERLFPLGAEGGVERWLDLATGKQIVGVAHKEDWSATEVRDKPGEAPAEVPDPERTIAPEGRSSSDNQYEPSASADLFDTSMPRLLAIARDALAARDIPYDIEGEHRYVTFRLGGEHTAYDMLISVNEPTEILVCYARVVNRVPVGRRAAACELLTRINYELGLGGFDMDMSDGELRFRTGIDVEGGALSTRMVDSLVGVCYSTFERYYPVIMRVVYGDEAPQAALRDFEREQQ